MNRKKKMNRREEVLKELRKDGEFSTYTDCPACGRQCYRDVTKEGCHSGEARETFICRSCGYIRDSHFRKDGTVRIKEPPVHGIYQISYKKGGFRKFGQIHEKVTKKHISWFKKVLEDPSVDKYNSYLKLTCPRKLGSMNKRLQSENEKEKRWKTSSF